MNIIAIIGATTERRNQLAAALVGHTHCSVGRIDNLDGALTLSFTASGDVDPLIVVPDVMNTVSIGWLRANDAYIVSLGDTEDASVSDECDMTVFWSDEDNYSNDAAYQIGLIAGWIEADALDHIDGLSACRCSPYDRQKELVCVGCIGRC